MKLTNETILHIAMEQSAIDENCLAEDFTRSENVIVPSANNPGARKYLKLPHICTLVSYGSNIVASIDRKYQETVSAYINKYKWYHCFETPNMHVLNDAFEQHGCRVCFMAEYWLPDLNALKPIDCAYETRVLTADNFAELYTDEWSNALCKERMELDVLGVGAYSEGRLIGLAGCSMDCEKMWQIGVDVLPEYRRQGIAAALTSRLALEILARDKVPFYCCAWCNIKSARNAINCGFKPAWVEMSVKEKAFVADINK